MTQEEKRARVRRELRSNGVDALICRLPENVLYLSGYWPNTGDSVILYPVDEEPVLIIPECDVEYVSHDEVKDIREYKVYGEIDIVDPMLKVKHILQEMGCKKRLSKSTIGYEASFGTVAVNHTATQVTVPDRLFFELLKDTFPDSSFVDCSPLIKSLRMVKTEREIDKMRICSELARRGFEKARKNMRPGLKESEVASIIESVIHAEGVGYKGTKRARGFAYVMSGCVSRNSWWPFSISSDKVIEEGDLVLIEFDACVDGYWCDFTRTLVSGEPTTKQREILEIVLSAEQLALKGILENKRASLVDTAAREYIEKSGFGKFFPHKIGHGVGFALHEMPFLSPGSDTPLEVNMTLAIEPGIYMPDFGGIRVEDNIVIREGKVEYLSDFDRKF